MSRPLALVVDDEADILDLIRITLGRMNVSAVTALTVAEAKLQLERHRPDLCLTDLSLPDGTGLDLLHHINTHHPDLPVAMITAHGNMESAVAAMKAGAFDFVAKPVDLSALRNLVESALRLRGRATPTEERTDSEPPLLGDSPAMQQIRALIAKLARTQAPVFITGESGTGKELAARLIHAQGPRRDGPFVPVNCGAIPHDLVESELFGHKKGSFSGALADKDGLFQAAAGGTLFLDELADLPLPAQVKLLRAIQEKCVRPVGAAREVPVDVRIISASHRDLAQEVEKGRFRQDLFYRINVIELRLPALRERPEDIRPLAVHILRKLARAASEPTAVEPWLSEEAGAALMRYAFPGNVRELENILERAVALCEGERIEVGDLYLPVNERAGALESSGAARVALDQTHLNQATARALGMTPLAFRYRLARLGIDRCEAA
ncbi:sigma-54-dependent transcriptional regulator [Allochromatium vinosum]|uniref:Two component, sigma54 specific, transcriptional regulator, Fis family n=1 Tax=Allochromatium vinosum (strain ATCC 17899 / DSM 180 / NBRC 103801 / NCIMB 10441 / D) TaxID=572477 RepID=D3RSG4_ALLVD|nr:sigma-54 dependent transcriptional regulator [Allochromatium vinosum]ADC62123.1 putative two component, sigma54 specific, transcriptional regulator, Fis family [Allochromatium vinosum DSM 180]